MIHCMYNAHNKKPSAENLLFATAVVKSGNPEGYQNELPIINIIGKSSKACFGGRKFLFMNIVWYACKK